VPWEPITRVDARVRESDPLLLVDVTLSGEPHPEWAEFFNRPVGVGSSSSWQHIPQVQFGSVEVRAQNKDELKKLMKYVDEAIGYANGQYQRVEVPRRGQEQQEREEGQREGDQRMQEAQKLLDEL
jgi:hypothetical protein